MPQKTTAAPVSAIDSLLNTYDINGRINDYMLSHLPAEVWTMKQPGGKGRTIAAIVGHIHNVRLMWLKSASASAVMPPKLEGDSFSVTEAAAALTASHQAVRKVLDAALRGDFRIKGFKPDAVAFIGYLIAHDAHHRGQISMLARQLGHPLPQSAMYGMWEWGVR